MLSSPNLLCNTNKTSSFWEDEVNSPIKQVYTGFNRLYTNKVEYEPSNLICHPFSLVTKEKSQGYLIHYIPPRI